MNSDTVSWFLAEAERLDKRAERAQKEADELSERATSIRLRVCAWDREDPFVEIREHQANILLLESTGMTTEQAIAHLRVTKAKKKASAVE